MKCRKCKAEIPDGSKYCPNCRAAQQTQRKPKSRGNGTGTVYKRENGTWIAVRTIRREVDAAGKVHRITATKSGFKTKKEALAYLPYLVEKPKQERQKAVTFKELYDKWEPTHAKSKSTINCYRAALKKFQPVWHEPVSTITVDDLQECMDDIPGKRTQENMKALCGLLYKYAIPRHIAPLNMGQYLVVGGERGLGKEGLPKEALDKIMEQVGKVPYADYVAAQCYLGFRPSELLELDAADYDRKARALKGGAKTEAGKNRTVTVSPKIQSIITDLTKGKISGPIFCAPDGSRMPIEKYREHFYAVLDKCGIENPLVESNGRTRRKYTPHSCRHTFASLMKNVEGADKDKLSLMGHTSTEMLRHYQDIDLESLRKITDAL